MRLIFLKLLLTTNLELSNTKLPQMVQLGAFLGPLLVKIASAMVTLEKIKEMIKNDKDLHESKKTFFI